MTDFTTTVLRRLACIAAALLITRDRKSVV